MNEKQESIRIHILKQVLQHSVIQYSSRVASRGAMICCLLLGIIVSLIGRSYPQTTVIRDGKLITLSHTVCIASMISSYSN